MFRGYVDGGPLEPDRGVVVIVQETPVVTFFPAGRLLAVGVRSEPGGVVYRWSWGVWLADTATVTGG